MSSAAISIRNVTKAFGSNKAVDDLQLDVPEGSLCGFLGPNGAGKTTTIRMIMSIFYPDKGSIDVLGSDALHNKDKIGYLPEERGLYRKMRVGDYLQYIARLKGLDSGEAKKRSRQWLERIQLPDVEKQKCEELSKGMQQKVQFLAAIIHDPDLIILDEPFSGLDPVNAELLNHLVKDLHNKGKTIIFSTHILMQAEQLCDRIFLINKGRKLLDATLTEIRNQFDPRTLLVEPLNGAEMKGLSEIEGVLSTSKFHDSTATEIELEENADPQKIMRGILDRFTVRSVELRRLKLDEVFVQQVRLDEGGDAAVIAKEELSHV